MYIDYVCTLYNFTCTNLCMNINVWYIYIFFSKFDFKILVLLRFLLKPAQYLNASENLTKINCLTISVVNTERKKNGF